MKGNISAAQQLRVLAKVWGTRKGYVFLPWINGDAPDKDTRRKSYHEGRAYAWPADREAIQKHLTDHTEDDLYFTPNLFKGKRRVEQLVMPERVLYADLDPVDPNTLAEKPTIAWESSPDRYQAIWLLDSEREGASKANGPNHRLTAAISADPSGWDSTQLLRVPGRPNFKFEYTADHEPNGVEGRGLLWAGGPRYTWDEFEDLPSIGSVSGDGLVEAMDEEVLQNIDRHEAWKRLKLRLPHRVRELYLLRQLDSEMDRSEVMWDISRSLADAGATSLEIVVLLRSSVWNKFHGRSDEIQRLMTTAQRAVNNKEPMAIEEDEPAKPQNITWLSDIVQQPIPRPSWLVKDIWTTGGCGFIAGAPKSYKSWMALDLAVSVATGGLFLNQPGYKVNKPKPVLYIQEEDDVRLVMGRLQTIVEGKVPERYWGGQITISDAGDLIWTGPTADIPMGVHIQTGFISSDESWQQWLDEVIAEHQFGLVIIDTLGTTAGDVDTDSSGELMTKLLKPLKVLAQKHGTSMCVVHHNKKSSGMGRAGNDMLGSVALHAWVDCAIYARSRDVDGTIAVEREAKLAPEVTFRLKIPYMQERSDGSRQLWDPEILLPGVGEEEERQPAQAQQSRRGASSSTKDIARKLKFMGKRGATLARMAEVLDEDPSHLLDLLQDAQEQGLVTCDSSGVWTTV